MFKLYALLHDHLFSYSVKRIQNCCTKKTGYAITNVDVITEPLSHKGRPTEAQLEVRVRQFAQPENLDFISGAESLKTAEQITELNEVNNGTP